MIALKLIRAERMARCDSFFKERTEIGWAGREGAPLSFSYCSLAAGVATVTQIIVTTVTKELSN